MGIMLSAPGLVCCAGNNREEFFAHAVNGDQSGIKPLVTPGGRHFLAGLVDCMRRVHAPPLWGETKGMYPEANTLPKQPLVDVTRLSSENPASDRLFHMTLAALEQIKPEVEEVIATYGPERVGVCAGSCDNGSESSLPAHRSYFSGNGFPALYALRQQSAFLIAEFIAGFFGIKGPCLTVATACASSAGAMVKGAQLIESGLVDAVISGGADLASETVLLGFAALEAVSDQICNPFSKNRKGITLGEGAAFFVMRKNEPQQIQSDDSAAKKPADIELLGWGESADAHHMTAPRPDGSGARAAMEEALNMAKISPGDVDYINLHGTGTPLNDSMEARAIQAVFADKVPPLSSTKPITGHTLGAAGALELGLCRMALTEGGLPAHCWDGQLDEEIPLFNFVAPNTSVKPKICMSNSFAFGGCNTSLIIGRMD